MYPIRSLDFNNEVGYEPQEYLQYDGDSSWIATLRLTAGQELNLNAELGDSAWYVVDGEVHAHLGGTTTCLTVNSALFVPRAVGLTFVAPHGVVDLIRVTKKAPIVGVQPATSQTEATPFHATVEPLDALRTATAAERLITQGRGSLDLHLYYAEMPAGCDTGPMHIHPFDQFQLVISGQATIRIGLDSYTCGPRSMAVLPAGVPHMLLNESGASEHHIGINVGDPLPIRVNKGSWDVAVSVTELSPIARSVLGPN